MNNPKILFLYTIDYPCHDSVLEQYVNTELMSIYHLYDKIYIFPSNYKNNSFDLPQNCEVIDLGKYKTNSKLFKFKTLFFSFFKTLQEGVNSKNKLFFKNFLEKLFFFNSCTLSAHNIYNFCLTNKIQINRVVHFSYWFSSWAVSLSVLKNRKILKSFYTRAHQGDVYFDNIMFHSFFQHYKIRHVSKVFTISKHATNYLCSNFPNDVNKFETAYLGIENNKYNPEVKSKNYFHLVSCSKITLHKRTHLICKILQELDFPTKWTHYGISTETYKEFDESLELLKSNKNIEVDIKGLVKNKQILVDYETIPIDLFVSTSLLEGLSFAMIESLSFGIPQLATDINGTREICNESTGYLLPLNFEIAEAVKFIRKLNNASTNQVLRKNCIEHYHKYFDAKINYWQFHKNLISNL